MNLEGIGDIRIKGNIILSLKRAKISTQKCSHPSCNRKSELHKVSLALRLQLLRLHRFYMPKLVRACNQHLHFEAWTPFDCENGENSYTGDQIEDMVDMLRADPKRTDGHALSGYLILQYNMLVF